jgi:dihydroflavonol-4-reductase
MSKILVTGANSLLATNTIIELLSRGYSVKGLLRNPTNFQYQKHPNLELIQGNINDTEAIAKAVKNCDSIIHVAAITDQSLLRYSEYQQVNALSTELLILSAIKENVKTIVYVSSANAFGYGLKENLDNETIGIRKPFTKSHYAKSKLEGQCIALSYKDKTRIIVVNPTFMIGAYDSKPSSGKLIMMGYKKRVIFYPPGGKNFIHVQDAAKGAVNAMETGKSGEAYILANENISYKEFFQKLSNVTNNRTVYIKIPRFILLFIGIIGNFLRLLRIKTSVSFSNMQIVCVNNYYNNKKVVKELNLTFQPIEKAIKDALEWFIKKKMIV